MIDEIDNFAVRRQVFIAITLQDFMRGKRVFERDERSVGVLDGGSVVGALIFEALRDLTAD